MSIKGIAKLATGNFGPDEMGAILEAVGVKVNFSPIDRSGFKAAFTRTGEAASLPSSRMVCIQGVDKDGSRIEALLVVVPPEKRLPAEKDFS
jgi:hypothetical protein